LLAHHFTQAGLTDAATEWWGKAGDQALRRSAFQEAISHLGKAIEMADMASKSSGPRAAAASPSQRLKLQTNYGRAIMWSKGYAAEETKLAFTRAKELAAGVDDPAERFVTYYGHWAGSAMRGDLSSAIETAGIFLRETQGESRTPSAQAARRMAGLACFWQGDFIGARAHLEEALRIHNPDWNRDAKLRFGDSGVAATVYLALTNWQLGNVARAHELKEDAVERAIESDHAPTQANTYHFSIMFEMLRGDAVAARRAAEPLVELSRARALSLFAVLGALHSAWVHARLGDREIGVTELRQAITAYMGEGNKLYAAFFQGHLAVIEAEARDAEGALTRIDDALALAAETGEHCMDAFLHRARGEILLKRDTANTVPAEEAFLTAIAVAQQQKARSFELRAKTSMARLWRDQGKPQQARELLAPAYGWFTEGFDTRDLKEAKALLDELAC
jgi:predicted ATPase